LYHIIIIVNINIIIIIIIIIIIDRAIRALGEIAMQIDSVSEEMTLALLQLIDMVDM
jgi:hypothetical protein